MRDYVLQPRSAPLELRIDYAQALNPQQYAAVTAPPGPALVLAGAGAGKTRTLVYRAAFLLEQGVPPENLLLLTFTNKAAQEMMRRVSELLGRSLDALWGGTFHAIGHRVLRRHAELVGYPRSFSILDREDAGDLLRACLAQETTAESPAEKLTVDALGDLISFAVNTHQPVSRVLAERFADLAHLADRVEAVHAAYGERKRATAGMDFDDLLLLWLRLFQDHPEVREHYQRRFHFVLVDEYQDTNQLQSELVDLLAARHDNLMAVGDDSQSIYSWRGANFRNLLDFTQRHPRAQVYKIETNYRSTPEVLALANAAIARNRFQHPKQLVPVRRSGVKPVLVVCLDADVQSAFVAQRVAELHEQGRGLGQMAVLYRSHFHALELQLALRRHGIPFLITSGMRFFEQAHVKDLAAFLRLIHNPADEAAFKRLARMLPGIGDKGAAKLWGRYAAAATPPPVTRLEPPAEPGPAPLVARLRALSATAPKRAAAAWGEFIEAMTQIGERAAAQAPPDQLVQLVLDAGYADYLARTYDNAAARLEDLHQLAHFARQFAQLEDCLAQLALLSNLEAEGDGPPADPGDRLRLTTVHQAKGLEFEVVFVIMLCDGMFPSQYAAEHPAGEEEERRLFYVAVTRAKEELYLTYPLTRTSRTTHEPTPQKASRFLTDLPPDAFEEWNLLPYGASAGGW